MLNILILSYVIWIFLANVNQNRVHTHPKIIERPEKDNFESLNFHKYKNPLTN